MPEPLRPVDAARILMRAAGFDSRDPSPLADEVWSAALTRAGLTFGDFRACIEAVDEHYSTTADRIMPVHIITIVKARRRADAEARVQADRAALDGDPARPALGSPEAAAVTARLRATIMRAAADRDAHVRAEAAGE